MSLNIKQFEYKIKIKKVNFMKLTELRKGEEARIIKIDKTGELKKD